MDLLPLDLPPPAPPFDQRPHKLLLIPGPIEVDDEVLQANAHLPMSHMALEFSSAFADCIRMTRTVLGTHLGQPFLIAGSGTLGWDQVAANLVEPDENVLVLNCGYFGDGFADCLQTYGANVDQLKAAEFGDTVKHSDIEVALKQKQYKLITITHVDTSTAVLSDIKSISMLVRKVSPKTLVVVDGVCSVASEEIQMDSWFIDVVLTASQKGLGAPPGLSIVVASREALEVFRDRSTPVRSYYANWNKWLPIMVAYEHNNPAYFATPPTNIIYAYRASLLQITEGPLSLQDRFKAHKDVSKRFRKAASDLGFKSVPLSEEISANGMSAFYPPEGLTSSDIVPRLSSRDIVISAGLHATLKFKYFRIGHMGISAVDSERGDIDRVLEALAEALQESRGVRTRLES